MRALLIMGPTASGKSALALALAERIGGEIINADSMQVYADLRVLTARPTPEEEAQAPHHLYGHVDAGERFSVGSWVRAASMVLADIVAVCAMATRRCTPGSHRSIPAPRRRLRPVTRPGSCVRLRSC
jgi:tRNA dimethylallyltransferase